jgi:pyruvate kinase
LPYITRLERNKKQIKLECGDSIRIAFDNVKMKDDGYIFVDKRIHGQLNIGDLVYINSSDVILRVSDKFKYCNDKVTNAQHFEQKSSFYDNISAHSEIGNFDLDLIPVNEEEIIFEANNFDYYFDDKIINRQNSMTKAYKDIIRKCDHRRSSIKSSSALGSVENSPKKRRNIHIPKDKSLRATVIKCEVVKEGVIDLNSYLEFTDSDTKLDAKDIVDISNFHDFVINFVSCKVNNAEHLIDIKDLLIDQETKLFAKIESEKAIMNFDSILANCDGIIIKLDSFFSKIPKDEVIS